MFIFVATWYMRVLVRVLVHTYIPPGAKLLRSTSVSYSYLFFVVGCRSAGAEKVFLTRDFSRKLKCNATTRILLRTRYQVLPHSVFPIAVVCMIKIVCNISYQTPTARQQIVVHNALPRHVYRRSTAAAKRCGRWYHVIDNYS